MDKQPGAAGDVEHITGSAIDRRHTDRAEAGRRVDWREVAVKACEAERIEPEESYMTLTEGDQAYNLAIEHCVKVIRSLATTTSTEPSYAELQAMIAQLSAELMAIRKGKTVRVEYDLSHAMHESAVRAKLIELGWTPPSGANVSTEPAAPDAHPDLKDLARMFADASENRKSVTLSAESCALLFRAMTTGGSAEPAQADGNPRDWLIDGSLLYRLGDDGANCDEINITMVHGSRNQEKREAAASGLLNIICASEASTSPVPSAQGGNIEDSAGWKRHALGAAERWRKAHEEMFGSSSCDKCNGTGKVTGGSSAGSSPTDAGGLTASAPSVIGYAVYGINGAGNHCLRNVKMISGDDTAGEWKSDDDGLGDRWAGNEPVALLATKAAQPDQAGGLTTEQHEAITYAAGFMLGSGQEPIAAVLRSLLAPKATQPQEPVAWAVRVGSYSAFEWGADNPWKSNAGAIPLYGNPLAAPSASASPAAMHATPDYIDAQVLAAARAAPVAGSQQVPVAEVNSLKGCTNTKWLVKLPDGKHKLYLAAPSASHEVKVPEGFALVPIAPTPAMVEEARGHLPVGARNCWEKVYAAMLAAAPAVPVPAEPKNLTADDVVWVTNDSAELGVKIGNQFFFLYKAGSLVYETGQYDNGSQMYWRRVFKREFGECAHPINYDDPTKIGTVSLADSDEWKPLPAAPSLQQGKE